MAKTLKELEQERKVLDQQWTLLKNQAKEWDNLLKKGQRITAEEREKLKVYQQQYGTVDKLDRKVGKLGDKINDITDELDETKKYIDDVGDGIDDLDSALISVGNTLGKNSKSYKDIKKTQDEINNTLSSVFNTTTRISATNTKLKEAADSVSSAYSNAQSSITLARIDLDNNKISQDEFNKLVQKAYANFDELGNSIDYSGRAGRELKAQVDAMKSKLAVLNQEANLSGLQETLGNTEELLYELISVENIFGKTSDQAKFLGTNFGKVEEVVEGLVGELANWQVPLGEAGREQQKLKSYVTDAGEEYKKMHSAIASINKQYAMGEISEENRVKAIKESGKSFLEMASYIDLSKIESEELRDVIVKMQEDAKTTADLAQKLEVRMQAVDNVMDSFSGIPAMGELNKLLKTNIKDTVAFQAAVFALGAALGKAAFDYFGAPIKAAMQAEKERSQNRIDTEANVAKLQSDAGFIGQQIAQDKAELEINNAHEVARVIHEAQYAGVKAAHEFSVALKQGAVQFERAAKTALFGDKIGSIGYGAAQMQLAGVGAEKVAEAMKAAAGATGKMPTGKMGADMALMAERTGQSVDNIAEINEYLQRSEGVSAEVAINLQEGMRAMADKAGISLGKLMTEIAEASKDALSYNIQGGKALAKQVAYANSIGVSFGDIAKAGKSMVLNYKDSIKAEMQLSTLLGEQVDLSEVRAKFAEGDTEGAMKALKAQGLDPATMDMFQKEALSQALGGMDLSSISKIAQNTGAQVGALEGASAQKGGQEFLGKTEAAEKAQKMAEAKISADSAIFDAKLSGEISKAFLDSDAEKEFRTKQNKAAQEAENLAGKMKEAWLETDAYKKQLSETMKLNFVDSLKETLISGAAMALSGFGATLLSKGVGMLFGGKKGGGGGGGIVDTVAQAAGGGGGITSMVTGGAEAVSEGGGMTSAVAGAADQVIPGAGGVIESISGTVGDAEEKAEEVMTIGQKITDFAKGIGNAIKEIGTGIGTFVSSIGKGVGAALKGILTGIGEGLMSLAPGLIALTPAIPVILSFGAALWLAAPALEAIAPPVMKVAEVIGTVLVEALRQAGPIITAIFEGIGKVIKSIGEAISMVITSVADSLVKIGSIDGTNLLAVAAALIPLSAGLIALGAAELINGIMGFIGALFGGGGPSIWEKLIELAQWGPGLKQAADAVGPLASAFVKLEDVDDGENLDDLMTNFKKAIIDTFTDDVITLLNKLSPSLINVAKSLSWLGNVGAGNNLSVLGTNLKSLIDSKTLDNLSTYGPKIDVFAKSLTGLNTALSANAAAALYALGSTSPILTTFGETLTSMATLINTAISTGAFAALANQTPILTSFAAAIVQVNNALSGGMVTNLGILSTLATGIDITTAAILKMSEALFELSTVNLNSINGIPWDKMTNFGKVPGGSIILAKNANNNFTIETQTAKNIAKIAEVGFKQDEVKKMQANSNQMVQLTKNLQALIAVLADNKEAAFSLSIDGRQVTDMIKRRADNAPPGKGEN